MWEDDDLIERTPLSPDRIAELQGLSVSVVSFVNRDRAPPCAPHAVSAVVANLYMELFEELALESAPSRPRFWKRYVDDTCCILRASDVDGLLSHLNNLRPTIKFTMELEEEESLPFFNI